MIPVAVFPPNGFKTSFVWWLSITNNNFNASSSSYLVQHNIHFVSKLNFINTQYSSIQVFCYLHSADSVYIAGAGAVVIKMQSLCYDGNESTNCIKLGYRKVHMSILCKNLKCPEWKLDQKPIIRIILNKLNLIWLLIF